jgi:excisionase family DNA binding protein
MENPVVLEGDALETLSVSQVVKLLHANRRAVNKLIDSGELPTINLGERRVPRWAIREWQRRYTGQPVASA